MINSKGHLIFAILDTTDSCWIGNDDGPLTYTDLTIARIAAQVLETQVFGTDLGARYKAVEYQKPATHLRDHLDTKMDVQAALRRIEGAEPSKPTRYIEATHGNGWTVTSKRVQ